MIGQQREAISYAALWKCTRELLLPLGMTEQTVPADWAAVKGPAEAAELHVARWQIGRTRAPVGECRIARLRGCADGLLALIGPLQPGRLPIFTAELLAENGLPELACLDLLAPGVGPELRDEVAEQATVLSVRHAMFLPRDEAVPRWAVEESPGGFLFTRTRQPEMLPRLAQAYEDYLNIWLDFACSPISAPPAADAEAALAAFRRSRAGRESFLERYFGEEWTRRFLAEFWYH